MRGRLGYTWGQALLYVTGGLAYGGNRNAHLNYWGATVVPPTTAPDAVFSASNSGNNIGWSLGGGLEYALGTNLTGRIEYLHVALGNSSNGAVVCSGAPGACVVAFGGATWDRSNHNSFDLVRVGLNYKFGGASAAPVLARY